MNFKKMIKSVGGLEFLRNFMISLSVVVVLAFALVIMGANLKASTTDAVADDVISNFTAGIGTLGTQVGTWITLASLVVIIGIISVVIYLVSRFGGQSEY
jgi:predicted PurR-regulated permease PerM